MKSILKSISSLKEDFLRIIRAISPIAERECNICRYKGYFKGYGRPMRLDAHCPNCGSLERHRLLWLSIDREEIEHFSNHNASVLHFAPEPILEGILRKRFKDYVTADLLVKADVVLNIESIDVEDECIDVNVEFNVVDAVCIGR